MSRTIKKKKTFIETHLVLQDFLKNHLTSCSSFSFYYFYYGGGGDILECLLSSIVIGSVSFQWPCVSPHLAFDRSQSLFAYMWINMHVRISFFSSIWLNTFPSSAFGGFPWGFLETCIYQSGTILVVLLACPSKWTEAFSPTHEQTYMQLNFTFLRTQYNFLVSFIDTTTIGLQSIGGSRPTFWETLVYSLGYILTEIYEDIDVCFLPIIHLQLLVVSTRTFGSLPWYSNSPSILYYYLDIENILIVTNHMSM